MSDLFSFRAHMDTEIDEDPHRDHPIYVGISAPDEETSIEPPPETSPHSISANRGQEDSPPGLDEKSVIHPSHISPSTFAVEENLFTASFRSKKFMASTQNDKTDSAARPQNHKQDAKKQKKSKSQVKESDREADKQSHRLRSMATTALYDTVLQDQDDLKTGIAYGKTAYHAGRFGYRGIRPAVHGAKYGLQQIRFAAKKVAARVMSSNGMAVLKAIAAKAALPAISAIIVVLLVFTSLLGTSCISDTAVTVSETYEYVTKLDANITQTMRRVVVGADDVRINGLSISSPVTFVTNIDYLLQYLSSKYHTVDLTADIDGAFGNTVRREIDAIHRSLYSYMSRTIPIPDMDTGMDKEGVCIDIKIKSLTEVLSPHIDDDQRSIMELSGQIGLYAGQQALSDPLPTGYYISDRWGWYIDGSQKKHRANANLIPVEPSAVLSPIDGIVTAASGGTVVIKSNDGLSLHIDGLERLSAASGSAIVAGTPIGRASLSGISIIATQDEHNVNPLLLLPQRSMASGDGQPLVDVARREVGNIGGDTYISWYGFNTHVDWCAIFISWCANQINVLNTAIPKYAVVDDGVAWFQSHGAWQQGVYTPRPGDIVFYDWENDGDPDHTGIVASVDGNNMTVIEGNTGDAPGVVKEKNVSLSSPTIFGFGTPTY